MPAGAASRFAGRFVLCVGRRVRRRARDLATIRVPRDGMAFLMIGGERYALAPGDTTLGGDSDELLRGAPLAQLPPFAVVTSDADATTIRRLDTEFRITVNGQLLGVETRTLRDGDQLMVGLLTFHVSDVRGREESTLPTAGRLTAVGGGLSHLVPAAGLVIGRDGDSDILLDSPDVSRRHAVVVPALSGYAISDESTNGV